MFGLKIIRIQYVSSQCTALRTFHRCASTALNKELTKPEASDSILQSVKSATHTLELLNVLAKNERPLNSEHVMQFLKSLFVLQKSGQSTLKKSEIINHPQFEKLLRDLKRTSRTLPLNDIIEALKVLSFVDVPSNTNIIYVLLNLLRRQINDITLGHVIFLDFLLKKFDKTPLVEALQIALPIIFQLQLQTQIDHENVPQLTELLLFSSRNKVSNQCIMSIVNSLTLHGTNLNVEEAKSVLWSLCDLRPYKAAYDKLLNNCFTVFNKHYRSLSFENIDSTLTRITDRFYFNTAFYNEEFYNKCASYAIEMDVGFENAIYILKKFNKVSFVNIFLLDYLSEKPSEMENLVINAKPNIYFNFIVGFSNANYMPKQWETLKESILSNPILKSEKLDLPWLKLASELFSLECYNKDLLEKIFNDEFLEKYLSKEQNTLDYLQLLLLYQSVLTLMPDYSGPFPSSQFINKAVELNLERNNFPLKSSLEVIFGSPTNVCTRVTTKYGHLIDHVIVFNEINEPLPINTDDRKGLYYVEEFERDGNKIIGIMTFSKSHYALNFPRLKGVSELRIRTLEALGINTVPVNLMQWIGMPEKDKILYLEREIQYKLRKKPING